MKEHIVLDDIAKALGVSKTTVSRAINNTGRVSKATRERVLAYVAETGFIPNASASNLSMSRTKNLAYSMPLREIAIMSSYFLECLFGVCRAAAQAGYNVIIVDDKMDELCHIAGSHKVDGLVLSVFTHGDAAMEKLVGYGIPLVLTGTSNVQGVIQTSYDARPAFRQLTNYLLDTWHVNIGLILTEKAYPANETRAEGFSDAMTARGNMNPRICWGAYDNKRMIQAMIDLYHEGIYGIICGDDSICTDLLSALDVFRVGDDEEKRKIAQTVRLASFHSNRFLQLFHSEIPTVIMAPPKLGEFAARMAIHEIEHGNAPRSTLIEYELYLPPTQPDKL